MIVLCVPRDDCGEWRRVDVVERMVDVWMAWRGGGWIRGVMDRLWEVQDGGLGVGVGRTGRVRDGDMIGGLEESERRSGECGLLGYETESDHVSVIFDAQGIKKDNLYVNLDSFPDFAKENYSLLIRKLMTEFESTKNLISSSEGLEDMIEEDLDPFMHNDSSRTIFKYFISMIFIYFASKHVKTDLVFDQNGKFHAYSPKLTIYHQDIAGKCLSIYRRGISFIKRDRICNWLHFDESEVCVFAFNSETKNIVSMLMQKKKPDGDREDGGDNLEFTLYYLDMHKLGKGHGSSALTRVLSRHCTSNCLISPNHSSSMSLACMIGDGMIMLIIQHANSQTSEMYDIQSIDKLFLNKSTIGWVSVRRRSIIIKDRVYIRLPT